MIQTYKCDTLRSGYHYCFNIFWIFKKYFHKEIILNKFILWLVKGRFHAYVKVVDEKPFTIHVNLQQL